MSASVWEHADTCCVQNLVLGSVTAMSRAIADVLFWSEEHSYQCSLAYEVGTGIGREMWATLAEEHMG